MNPVPLNDQQEFRLNTINEIYDYLVPEIKKAELMNKRLSKCIASFECFDNKLIVLSVTTGIISIASFGTVIGAPVGIASASFILAFSIFAGIVKKLLKTARNKKRKDDKNFMLSRSKLTNRGVDLTPPKPKLARWGEWV